MSGGEQEAYRWEMRSHHTKPTVSVIEPAQKDDAEANTPFGFARVLEPESEAPHVETDHWEGQGL
jgi:hypothetical protein